MLFLSLPYCTDNLITLLSFHYIGSCFADQLQLDIYQSLRCAYSLDFDF